MLSIFAIIATVLSMTLFQSALSSACTWDGECKESQFCETTQSECRDCLRCEDLKREPLSSASSCIKTVADCGFCFKGLVEDRINELKCVPPTPEEDVSSDGTMITWIVVGCFLVLFIVIAAAFFAYLWRARSSKFNGIQSDTILPVITRSSYPQPPTAPESPPPYRANSEDHFQPGEASDAGYPLIKTGMTPLRYLESEGPRKASVFNPPAYVRYDEPTADVNDVNDNYVVDHDETTSESQWTPGPSSNNATLSEPVIEEPPQPLPQSPQPQLQPQPKPQTQPAGELSAALAAARSTDLVQPPAKRTKTTDSNENMSSGDEEPQDSAQDMSARNAQQFNIVIQVNQKF